MCAGERVDAVNLDETKSIKHSVKVIAFTGPRSRTQQQVLLQKQAAGALIVQKRACHRVTLSPMPRQWSNARVRPPRYGIGALTGDPNVSDIAQLDGSRSVGLGKR